MKYYSLQFIAGVLMILFSGRVCTFSHTSEELITLGQVFDTLSLCSNAAKTEELKFRNELLEYENYRKGFFPAISLNVSPIGFNRSLRLLQQAADGSYSYVEDYSNSSGLGVIIRQKIGFTGGELNVGSNLNYLHEYFRHRKSFGTAPFIIGYSQQLWGGRRLNRLESRIVYEKRLSAVKQYCTSVAGIQHVYGGVVRQNVE